MHIEAAAKGGRRSLDAGVNIVPYIDMLMTLMIFLMVTAVWTRMSSLDTASSSSGSEPCASCGDPVPPVHVRITGAAFVVESAPALDLATAIQLSRHWVDERAAGAHAIDASVGVPLDVEVDDGVRLDRVASFIDAAKGAGLSTPSLHGVAR